MDRVIVSFALNKKCNENCEYCCSVQQGLPKLDLPDEEIFSNFDKCLSRAEYILFTQGCTHKIILPQILGGEPALWSEWLVKKVQERLSCYEEYRLFTNGTKNKAQDLWTADPRCHRAVHIVHWKDKVLEPLDDRDYYVVVVTKKDLPFIADFVKQNPKVWLSPCWEKDPELNITFDDYKEMLKIQIENGCTRLPTQAQSLLETDSKVNTRKCTFYGGMGHGDFDCVSLKVSACCHGWAHSVDLDEWQGDVPDCKKLGCNMFVP